MKLYDYFASASAFRVRIALNLKNLEYERIPIDYTRGEARTSGYLSVNPSAMVPALVVNGRTFTESLAIIEYLDETVPEPRLLPGDTDGRARVRALALQLACGIQPLHPGRVTTYLGKEMGVSPEGVRQWCVHWIGTGMAAVEALLSADGGSGDFCHGDSPSLADVVLVPQIYVAINRFGVDCDSRFPTASAIYGHCMAMPQFREAAPDRVKEVA